MPVDLNSVDPAVLDAVRERLRQRVRDRVQQRLSAPHTDMSGADGVDDMETRAPGYVPPTGPEMPPEPPPTGAPYTPLPEGAFHEPTIDPRAAGQAARVKLLQLVPEADPAVIAKLPDADAVQMAAEYARNPQGDMHAAPSVDRGFLGNLGTGLRQGATEALDMPGLPIIGPATHAAAERARMEPPAPGAGGFIGQNVGGFAGLVNPGKLPENVAAIAMGGVASKVAGPVLAKVAQVAGPKVAAVVERGLANAAPGAVMAAEQQAMRETWEDPAASAERVLKAAGVGGATAAVGGEAFHQVAGRVLPAEQTPARGDGGAEPPVTMTPEAADMAHEALWRMSPEAARFAGTETTQTGEPSRPLPPVEPGPERVVVDPAQAGEDGAPSGIGKLAAQDVSSMSVAELRAEAARRGVSSRGSAEVLRSRLQEVEDASVRDPAQERNVAGGADEPGTSQPVDGRVPAVVEGEGAPAGDKPGDVGRVEPAPEYERMTARALRQEAESRGLESGGGRAEVVRRLTEDDAVRNQPEVTNAIHEQGREQPSASPEGVSQEVGVPDREAVARRAAGVEAATVEEGQARQQAGAAGRGGEEVLPKPALSDRLDAVAERARQRIKERQIPRARGAGASTLPQDVVDAAVYAVAKAASKGITAGKALSAAVKTHVADLWPERAKDEEFYRKVRAVTKAAIKDMGGDPEKLEGVLHGIMQHSDELARPKDRVAAVKAVQPKPSTEPIRDLGTKYRSEQKGAAAGFRSGFEAGKTDEAYRSKYDRRGAVYKAEKALADERAKAPAEKLAAQLSYSERATAKAYRAGRVDATRELRVTIQQIRDDASLNKRSVKAQKKALVSAIRDILPADMSGRYLEAVRDVTNYAQLTKALDRVQRDAVLYEGRSLRKKADKIPEAEFRGLEPELRTEADAALSAVRRAAKVLSPEGQKGRSVADLELARDELHSALNSIKAALHEQKTLDTVQIKGEAIEAQKVRAEVGHYLSQRGELGRADLPESRDVGWLHRKWQKRTNLESLMGDVDNWKGGGPGSRLFRRMLSGRRKMLELDHAFNDQFGEIVTRNGYESVGHFLAELSGTLGPRLQKRVRFRVGTADEITLGQAAYLYAASKDVGFLRRVRDGQELQFRDDPTGKPFGVSTLQLRKLADKLPDNVKAIIDEAKAAYDAHYFPQLSAVNKRLKGYHLEKVKGYWGIKLNRSYTEGKGTPQMWRASVIRALEESGYLQERVGPGKSPIQIGDFGTDILLRSKSAAMVIGKAETTKLLARVFLHPDVMTPMSERLGISAVERMERRISEWSGGELYHEGGDRSIRKLMSMWARSKTQLRLTTWARNAFSGIPRIANEIGIKGAAGGTIEPSWGSYQELRRFSPEARERWSSGGVGSFYQGSGAHIGSATVREALSASIGELGHAVKDLATGNMRPAADSFAGAWKSWQRTLDAITVGNYFDAVPAVVAYKHFLGMAPKTLTGDAAKVWAARHAMRAFERTGNTGTIEYANDIQLDARESSLIAGMTQFSGDTAKSMNMLYEAAHKGATRAARTKNLAKTMTAIAAGNVGSAAVSALWALALGESLREVRRAGVQRGAGEFLSLLPGGSVWSQFAYLADPGKRHQAPELQTPITSLVNQLLSIGATLADAADRIGSPAKKGKLSAGDKGLAAVEQFFDVGAQAMGLPTQYVRDLIKAVKNYSK